MIADLGSFLDQARVYLGENFLPLLVAPAGQDKVTLLCAQRAGEVNGAALANSIASPQLDELIKEFGHSIDVTVAFQFSPNLSPETVKELYNSMPQPSHLKKVILEENRNRIRIWYKHPVSFTRKPEPLERIAKIFPTHRIEICDEGGAFQIGTDPRPPQIEYNIGEVLGAHCVVVEKVLLSLNLTDFVQRLRSEQEAIKDNEDAIRRFDKLDRFLTQIEKLESIRNDAFSSAMIVVVNYSLKGFFRFIELIDHYNAGRWKKAQITFKQMQNSWAPWIGSINEFTLKNVDSALQTGDYEEVYLPLRKILGKYSEVTHLERFLEEEALVNLGLNREDINTVKMQLERFNTALKKGNIGTALSNLEKVTRALKRATIETRFQNLFFESLQIQQGWLKILQKIIPETVPLQEINLHPQEKIITFKAGVGGTLQDIQQEIMEKTSCLVCILEPLQPNTILWDRFAASEMPLEHPLAIIMLPANQGLHLIWPNFTRINNLQTIKIILEYAMQFKILIAENPSTRPISFLRYKNVQKAAEEFLPDLITNEVPEEIWPLDFSFKDWPEKLTISYSTIRNSYFDLNAFAANLKGNLGIGIDLLLKQTPEEIVRIVNSKMPSWLRLIDIDPELEENKVTITISNDYSVRAQVVEFEKALQEELNLKVRVKFRFDEKFMEDTVRMDVRSFFAAERVELDWTVINTRPQVSGVIVTGFFLYPVSSEIIESALESLRVKFELPIELRITPDVSVRTEINYLHTYPKVHDAIFAHGWKPNFPLSVEIPRKYAAKGNRKDFTNWHTFTIDADGATMFEDALSVEQLQAEPLLYLIGVHITDPLWVLGEYPEIEENAFRLARSVYFPDEPRFLFPKELSKVACSLRVGEIRPCISFLLQVSEEGFVEYWEIVRSVIKPERNFTYSEVNRTMFNKIGNFFKEFQILYKLAAKIWDYRVEHGGIRLSRYTDWQPAQRIVEEMMILANRVAALELVEKNPPHKRIFRSQPIDIDQYLEIKRFLQEFQQEVNFLNRSPSAEISRLIQTIENRKQRELVFKKISQIIAPAEYSTTPQMHFLLGIPFYTSCTAPLRRFADFEVLRLLTVPEYEPRDLGMFCRHCTAVERIGRQVEGQVRLNELLFVLSGKIGIERRLERVWGSIEGPCFFQLVEDEIFLRWDGDVPESLYKATEEGGTVKCIIEHVSTKEGNATIHFPDIEIDLEMEIEVLRSVSVDGN